MSFGKLKTALRGIINRKDCTDALAGDFVNRAIREIERVCRVGPMEQLVEASTWDGTKNNIAVPSTYIELIDIFTNEGTLRQVSKDELFRTCPEGRPAVFTKVGRTWLVKPAPAVGTTVFVHFYGETEPLQVDTDENVWTRSAFNAALYGAAALAADYFQMEDQYVQRFQGKSDALVEAILSQSLAEQWAGPIAISRPHGSGDY